MKQTYRDLGSLDPNAAQEKLFLDYFVEHPELRASLLLHCGACGTDMETACTGSDTFPHRLLLDYADGEVRGVVRAAAAICPPCRDRGKVDAAYNEEISRRICKTAGVPDTETWAKVGIERPDEQPADPAEAEARFLRLIRDTYRDKANARPWIIEGIHRAARLEESGLPWVLQTASDVFAEAYMNSIIMLSPECSVIVGERPAGCLERVLLARILSDATPVLWENDTLTAARDMTVPRTEWHCDAINPPIQYWTWPREIGTGDESLQAIIVVDSEVIHRFHLDLHGDFKRAGNVEADKLLNWPRQRFTEFISVSKVHSTNSIRLYRTQLLDGTVFPDAFDWKLDPEYLPQIGAMYSMTAFMNSPFIVERAMDVVQPPRAMRREAERKHGITDFPKARFLTLRRIRADAGHHDEPDTLGPTTQKAREYTRSWIISMHWRSVRYGPKRGQSYMRLFPPVQARPDLPFVPRAEKVVR